MSKESPAVSKNRIKMRKLKRLAEQNIEPSVFILIPHRNREDQYDIFRTMMEISLKKSPHIAMLFVEQSCLELNKVQLPFNKGAMLNIAFIFLKRKYPMTYRSLTIVTHDIDVVLSQTQDLSALFSTPVGKIRHVFGFRHTLGGITVINASDFEDINGYPNVWGWGCEDNKLQERARKHKIPIVRDKEFLDAEELKISGITFLDHTAPLHVQPRSYLLSEWARSESGEADGEGISTLTIEDDAIYVMKPRGRCKHINILILAFGTGYFPDLSVANRAFKTYLVKDNFEDGKVTMYSKASASFTKCEH
jgi:hypothetical protein